MKLLFEIFNLMPIKRQKQLPWIIFLMVLGAALEVLGLGLIMPLMNYATGNSEDFAFFEKLFNPSGQITLGYVLIIAFGMAYVVKAVYLSFLALMVGRLIFTIKSEVCCNLLNFYLHVPYLFHVKNNSAKLIRNVTNETNQLVGYALSPLLVITSEVIVILAVTTFLLILEPLGTVTVVVLLFVLALCFHKIVSGYSQKLGAERQEADGNLIQKSQETLGGIKDITISGKQDYFRKQFRLISNQTARVSAKQYAITQVPRLYLESLGAVTMSIFLFAQVMIEGDIVDAIPIFSVFAMAAFRLLPSANRILSALNAIKYSQAVIETLGSHVQVPPMTEVKASIDTRHFDFNKRVTLSNVSYTYPDSEVAALSKVNLTIRKGESVGIVGKSGSGKTTLVNLLLGLLPPSSGDILVDGKNINKNLKGWQAKVGYVQQDIFLLDESVKNNIAFGLSNNEIDETKLLNVISEAQLDDFVNALPGNLLNKVGERGVRLSGGQKQRLGIARALYQGVELLVFDEATSALDGETEKEIIQGLKRLHRSKTVVIIAHRLSTIQHCDRVITMQDGKIVSIQNSH